MRYAKVNGKDYVMDDMRKLVTIEKNNAFMKAPTESWYVAAHLNRKTDRIVLQYHLLIMSAEGMPSVVSLNINLVNEAKELCKSLELAFPLEALQISTDRFFVEGPDFQFSGDADSVHCAYHGADCQIELACKTTRPVLKYLGEGFGDFLGAEQYGYSFPAMDAHGQIALDGVAYLVDGIAWYDRQWGDLPDYFLNASMKGEEMGSAENKVSTGRTTFYNPQLSNGVAMSLGEVYRDLENIYTYNATISEPDGTIILVELTPPECSEYWTSPTTGHRYPTKFKFTLAPVNCELTIEVPYKPQQIVSGRGGMTKYEGAAKVSGTYKGEPVTGDCYVELLGDWF